MRNFIKSTLLLLAIISTALYSAISYSQGQNSKPAVVGFSKDDQSQFLQDIVARVKTDYVEEKTDKQLAEAAASGILSSLDPHSAYLNEDDFKEMQVQTKGEFGGVGIEITVEYSLIKVISAIEGTPAEKAGIKSGDYISKVDGKSVVGLKIEDVVKRLRGKPNTKVSVTILRKGEKTPLEIILQRQNIQIKAVRSNKEQDVAYIKINSFSEQASGGVESSLKKIINQIGSDKIKGIVLDLRGNPGGLLDEAVKVSDVFLDKDKTIVSISGRNKSDTKIYKDSANQSLTKDIPVAVLINEGSASASEIVAGALQDNKRAVILGTKSFGKGSVQSVIPLSGNQGALKMTTALYYTPSGKSIQAHGIDPDILIEEAKIEKSTKDAANVSSEASLDGHLKSQIEDEIKDAKNQSNDENFALYGKDYQLARAIDLLRGISVYKDSKK
ncbi:MAG: C-terminal processing peptidase [Rickettsiaceae bacterium]|nr:C-terminal processing peptidase [Rickettsiaceae bacterium]